MFRIIEECKKEDERKPPFSDQVLLYSGSTTPSQFPLSQLYSLLKLNHANKDINQMNVIPGIQLHKLKDHKR